MSRLSYGQLIFFKAHVLLAVLLGFDFAWAQQTSARSSRTDIVPLASRSLAEETRASRHGHVNALDWTVIVIFLLATLAVGLWTAKKTAGSSADYFVGSRAMGWKVVGASMFASNIGTEHFIGQAGSAAHGGMGVGLYEWLSVYLLLLLAYFFAPFYIRLGLTTVTEYAQDRFGTSIRLCVTLMCLAAYVLTKISATLFTGVILVEVLYGGEVNVYFVAILLVLITASYTIAGGLKAVMLTDALQMAIFVVGGIAGLVVSLTRVSYGEMRDLLPDSFFHVIRSDGEYAWHAMFIGQPIGSCWYWCIDQFIVQRVLAAKSLRHGQSGCIFAGFMKFLPPFLLCIPGMAARALYEKCLLAPNDDNPWCDTGLDDAEKANKAYPLLVVLEFPAGLRGLIVTAMFMAMLSSLSSVYNSAATLVTIDFYKCHWNPAATEQQLLHCGRLASLVMTVLTFAWFPVMTGQHGLLYLFVQSVSMHIFPTLVVIFLLGMLTTRVNVQGAIAGLVAGAVLGLGQMIVSLAVRKDDCQKPFFKWGCMHFMHFAVVLAIFVALVTCVASRLYDPPSEEQLAGRTIWTVQRRKRKTSTGVDAQKAYDIFVDDGGSTPKDSSQKQTNQGLDPFALGVTFGTSALDGTTDAHAATDRRELDTAIGASLPKEASDGVTLTSLDARAASLEAKVSTPQDADDEDDDFKRTKHDRLNTVASFTLFCLMAVVLMIWA